jgi:DNA-binding NarL/FixJ family response regulator/PAS domain-containing protein
MPVTDHEAFRRRRRQLQAQVDDLISAMESDEEAITDAAAPTTTEALQRSLMELRIAEEELRAQAEELGQAYEHLIEEREHYRQLFDQAPVGYLVTDGTGSILECNRAVAQLLRRPRWQLVDTLLLSHVSGRDRRRLRDVLDEAREGARAAGRLHLRAGDLPVQVAAVTGRDRPADAVSVRWILVPVTATAASHDADDVSLTVHVPAGGLAPAYRRLCVLPPTGPAHDRVRHLCDTVGAGLELAAVNRPDDAVAAVLEARPDLVIVDLAADDTRAALPALRRTFTDLPLVGIRRDGDDAPSLAAVAAGIDAVVGLHEEDAALLACLQAVAVGLPVVPPGLRDAMRAHARHAQAVAGLDEADQAVLRQVVTGTPTDDLAARLHVSPRTAKRRVSALMRRFAVGSRAELAAIAARAWLDVGAEGDAGGRAEG